MLVELLGQSGRDDDNFAANTSRLMNVYAERTTDGERVLKSVLGMVPLTNLGGVFVRAMSRIYGRAYAVCGGRLWRIRADGSNDDLGEVDTGAASIAGNNGYVTVQAGTRYFVYNPQADTLVEPAAGAFSAVGSVEFFDNYSILTESGGRRFQWSDLAAPGTLPGLNFSTADARDDNLLRALAMDGRLYLFKEGSCEVWYNTGQAGPDALARVAGGVWGTGLATRDTICRFEGGAFAVGSDGRAHVVTASGFQPVSTPPVETAIRLHRPLGCITYTDEGHTFLCIQFRDVPSWCYDLATGEWHERGAGAGFEPWGVSASAQMGPWWIVGRNNGEISTLRRSNADGARPLVREVTSRTLRQDGARTVLRELELFARQGFGPGIIDLHVSRDGGATWTPPKPMPIGAAGDFGKRLLWRNLGQARAVTVKIRWSDPRDICLATQARIVTT